MTVLAALESYIDVLGAPVLACYGIGDDGKCLCALKAACKSPGKHPNPRACPNGFKNATLDKSLLRQWVGMFPQGNWAIRTGCVLRGRPGKFLGVPDIDPRNGGFASATELAGLGKVIPETIKITTGGGGYHSYLAFAKPPASRSIAPGIDFQGCDKYVMIPPSRHESGNSYVGELGALVDAPDWLEDETGLAMPRPGRDGEGTARETVLGEAFTLAGLAGPVQADGTMWVKCIQAHLHSDGRGMGEDSSTVVLPPAGGSRFGGWSCRHGNCANLKWTEVLAALPREAVEAAKGKYPMLAVASPVPVVKAVVKAEFDFRSMLAYKADNTNLRKDIVNVITILTYDPRWKGILKFDDFGQVLRITAPPPWHPDDAPRTQGDVWSDEDTTRMAAWMHRCYNFPAPDIHQAVYVVGKRDAINPLVAWLDSLVWDGTARLDTWLSRYIGAVDSPYVRAVGAKWCISAVARAYKPGCKADHMMILEGAQGKLKSTALRVLAGESYFSDTPIEIGNKDAFQALRGKWIIEMQELASLNKSDAERAKAFFSSPTDRYRPSYGREMVEIPRSTVFCGTVNLGTYLRDATGGRRYWPIVIGVIDVDGLGADREQIWAEAVARFRAGSVWWPSYDETPLFEAQQEQREIGDVWESTVFAWLGSERAAALVRRGFLTTEQIAEYALAIEVGKLGYSEQTRIASVMLRSGWKRTRGSIGGGKRVWGYTNGIGADHLVQQ